MWNWSEIARSFDFRNIAKTPTVSRLLIDYKGLIKKLKSRQKTIKCPARSQRSWYMSKSSCLLKIYGITVKLYIKDKSNDNIFMSFNEHCNHCLVTVFQYTTFINFINSFRFDTSFNFLLYIYS
jgi:hypothetical protein